ncbi:Sec-independent protein translocase protein TatB [Aliidiomarina maris]|uniref:Sec-independent protein translocase protein TatB n=1 Tax=Aliidiomarina maris TaxID=531312 RepID=A0A327WYV7_9GAMM|nr:Sec-independent protein translocase protein TatB [Aliidiomarina maris]MBA3987650.1 twin-arginine translocase subunit TatB [Idiomarina sp.]MCL5050221.1 Sec-independent protein translocase protein TatB [Bacillota bacterium]RAJ98361.1 Sec-independent protein translocase TatB [Aliidiomarina maris]RUO24820.1 twin-arginine translocase subunit TatB [Aliidiomarina maris]
MFDIGFWELLVVGLIGLVILGPERFPRAIRSLQASLHKVRQFGSRMEAEINHELRIKELHDNLKKIEQADDIDNLPAELKQSLAELQRAAASVNRPYAKPDAPEPTQVDDAAQKPDSVKVTDTHQQDDNTEGRNDRTS